MRTETDGQSRCHDFIDAAERVAIFLCLVDQRHHFPLSFLVGTIQWRITGNRADLVPGFLQRRRGSAAELNNVTADPDTECCKKLFCNRPTGDARGGLAGRGPLENVAKITGSIFLPACEVGMTRTRTFYKTRVF